MSVSTATKTSQPIEWFEPKKFEVHESRMFEVACACPDRCGGELRFTGDSMPHTYGVRSHYHQCDRCKKMWLVKGHRYPLQRWVRIEHVGEFLRDYGGTATKQASAEPQKQKA